MSDLTDTWTKNLSEKSKAKQYILAMLLNITTKNNFNNKNKIQEIMNSFLDSTSSTSLSASGLKELHKYCFGGYKRILKECENATPSSLVVFLKILIYLYTSLYSPLKISLIISSTAQS